MSDRPTAAASRVKVESLETRRLLADFQVTSFGAVPGDGQDDWAAISNALLAARSGDKVIFAPGEYNVSKTLTFRNGQTIMANNDATLKFNLPGSRTYGAVFFKDSSNITVTGLKFDGGAMSLAAGSKYTNISIVNNEITNTNGTAGVFASIPSDKLIIEGNKIHDFKGWGVILWHMNNGSYSKNKLCGVTQGAHILAPRDNNTFSFNVGRHLTRMGIEMQAHNHSVARNTTVEGNVFYDWVLPYRDSFGLSIVPDNSINTRIINNYLSANHTGDWNPEAYNDGQGQRYGYGIEAGFESGEVSGNIIGGPFANMIVVSHPNTTVRNNKMFGVPKWRAYVAAEGGPNGSGSWTPNDIYAGGNTTDRNFANMPAHSAEDPCAGLPGGGGIPTPEPNPGGPIIPPSNLAARILGPNTVELSWRDNSLNETGFRVERSYFGAEGPFTQVGQVIINTQKWTNFGVLANKTMWFRVRAYGPPGFSEYSNVIEVRTPPLGGTGTAPGGTGAGGHAGAFAVGPTRGSNLFGGSSSGTSTRNDPGPFSDLLI